MAERVTDLRDVRDRIVAQVLGVPPPGLPAMAKPSVVVASDLAPADTATLDLDHVVAIVTELGGPTSHTAIIAAQLNLPCVVRVSGALGLADDDTIAVDAAAGTVIARPRRARCEDEIKARAAARAALKTATGGAGKTKDGTAVQLLANIGKVEDAERAAKEDVEGVGLFRTEVLFLDPGHRADRRRSGQGLQEGVRGVRRPQGRRPHPRRRRRQAAGLRAQRGGGEPGARRPRPAHGQAVSRSCWTTS